MNGLSCRVVVKWPELKDPPCAIYYKVGWIVHGCSPSSPPPPLPQHQSPQSRTPRSSRYSSPTINDGLDVMIRGARAIMMRVGYGW